MGVILPESRRLRRLRRSVVRVLHGRTHGRRGTYVDGCRCDPCTDAEADYQHQRDRRRAADDDRSVA